MSFGRPPGFSNFGVTPPERGSFPLDHDGECKTMMLDYLKCLRTNKSQNGACRAQSKEYLECRMSRGLMERDNWENLGLADVAASTEPTSSSSNSNSSPSNVSPGSRPGS